MHKHTTLRAALALAAAAAGPAAHAQQFPTQPVHVIVPFPPGGIDTVARLLADSMAKDLGQPVVVENRAGANGMVGTVYAAQAKPDGYTLVFTTSSTLITGVLMMKHAQVDPVKDFAPVAMVYAGSQVFATHKSVPVKTFGEFLKYARANPRKLYYSTSGIGSVFHLAIESMKKVGKFDIVHVPFKGTGPAAQALFGAQVQVGLPSVNSAKPFIQDGTIVPLAVLRAKRHPDIDVPTVGEALPGFERPPGWIGMLAPAGTPAAIVKQLNAAVVKGSHQPKVLAYLENGGNEHIAGSVEDAAKEIRDSLVVTRKMMDELGIRKQ